MTISGGYLACWECMTYGGDVTTISPYYVSDNKPFKCAIICDGTAVRFFYNKIQFAKWNIFRATNDVDFYLGGVYPQDSASETTSFCQMNMQYCKIYSIAK